MAGSGTGDDGLAVELVVDFADELRPRQPQQIQQQHYD